MTRSTGRVGKSGFAAGAVFAALMVLLVVVSTAQAADVRVYYPVDETMQAERIRELFSDSVTFYWGNQSHPPVAKSLGTFKTSKRTNALGKTREDACAWAMASALVSLRDRAEREGGNAVVNIVSNIKDVESSSDSEFQCLAGTAVVNVALKGTVVTLVR